MSSVTATISNTMERLSSKAGVIASLAIDRISAQILQSSGALSIISAFGAARASATAASTTASNDLGSSTMQPSTTAPTSSTAQQSDGMSAGMNEFAVMIWNYVNSTGQLVQDMDSEV